MQIQESDLNHASAVVAADKLRKMIGQGKVDGEYQYGALNQVKILKGHVLLKQALEDRKAFGANSSQFRESRSSFCTWLAKEGFWYD